MDIGLVSCAPHFGITSLYFSFLLFPDDIGGFEGKPDPGLYKRWFAFGALSSHSRLHGSGSYRVRSSPPSLAPLLLTHVPLAKVPWVIDPTGSSDAILRHFISLKLSLMPYLYATAISTHRTGTPMMRPLFFEFPEDKTAWTIDEAYMLGEDLYVAPVFSGTDSDPIGSGGFSAAGSSFSPDSNTTSNATSEEESKPSALVHGKASIQVYIPPGDWFSLLAGEFYTGPCWSTQEHSYTSIPLFLRPGSAIVFSGGAPVDFYFDELGAWKLKELGETEVEDRAWKSDGEWRACGAQYDYANKITVVVNTSRPPATGVEGQKAALDIMLHVPDSQGDRLGENSADIRVQEVGDGKVRAEIVRGDVRGAWRVVRVGKDTGVVQKVTKEGQKSLDV